MAKENLYQAASQRYKLGTEDEFNSLMQNEEDKRFLYEKMKADGLDTNGYAEFSEYEYDQQTETAGTIDPATETQGAKEQTETAGTNGATSRTTQGQDANRATETRGTNGEKEYKPEDMVTLVDGQGNKTQMRYADYQEQKKQYEERKAAAEQQKKDAKAINEYNAKAEASKKSERMEQSKALYDKFAKNYETMRTKKPLVAKQTWDMLPHEFAKDAFQYKWFGEDKHAQDQDEYAKKNQDKILAKWWEIQQGSRDAYIEKSVKDFKGYEATNPYTGVKEYKPGKIEETAKLAEQTEKIAAKAQKEEDAYTYLSGAIKDVAATSKQEADDEAKAYGEGSNYVGYSSPSSAMSGAMYTARHAEDIKSPTAVAERMYDKIKDTEVVDEFAKKLGKSREEALQYIYASCVDSALGMEVSASTPKSNGEYYLKNLRNNGIGRLMTIALEPLDTRQARQQALDNYSQTMGSWARFGSEMTNMGVDVFTTMPLFGGVGGAVSKGIMYSYTAGLARAGAAEALAARAAMQTASKGLTYFTRAMGSAATFGTMDFYNSVTSQIQNYGEVDLEEAGLAGLKGTGIGAIVGTLGQMFSGLKYGKGMLERTGITTAGVLTEAGVFTASGIAEKISRGEDINAEEILQEAMQNVAMVLSFRGKEAVEKFTHGYIGAEGDKKSFIRGVQSLLAESPGQIQFSDTDKEMLGKHGIGGNDTYETFLSFAEKYYYELKQMPDNVKGDRDKESKWIMENTVYGKILDSGEVSREAKDKLMSLMTGANINNAMPALFAQPYEDANGNYVVDLLGFGNGKQPGTLQVRRRFKTQEEADAYIGEMSSEMEKNRIASMECLSVQRESSMLLEETISRVSKMLSVDKKDVARIYQGMISGKMSEYAAAKKEGKEGTEGIWTDDEYNVAVKLDNALRNIALQARMDTVERVREEVGKRYGKSIEEVEEIINKPWKDRTVSKDEQVIVSDYLDSLNKELGIDSNELERAIYEKNYVNTIEGQERAERGKNLVAQANEDGQSAETPEDKKGITMEYYIAEENASEILGSDAERYVMNLGRTPEEQYNAIQASTRLSVEQKQALQQFAVSRARMNAMVEKEKAVISAMSDEIVKGVDNITNEDGNVYEVKLKNENETVYIVRGDVNPESLTGSIWIKRKDGEPEQVDRKQIDVQLPVKTAEDLKQERLATYREEVKAKAGQEMDVDNLPTGADIQLMPGRRVTVMGEYGSVKGGTVTDAKEGHYKVRLDGDDKDTKVAPAAIVAEEEYTARKELIDNARASLDSRQEYDTDIEETAPAKRAQDERETSYSVDENAETANESEISSIMIDENGNALYRESGKDATVNTIDTLDGIEDSEKTEMAANKIEAAKQEYARIKAVYEEVATRKPTTGDANYDAIYLKQLRDAWNEELMQAKTAMDDAAEEVKFWEEVSKELGNRVSGRSYNELIGKIVDGLTADSTHENVDNYKYDGRDVDNIYSLQEGVSRRGKRVQDMNRVELSNLAREMNTTVYEIQQLDKIARDLHIKIGFADYLITEDGKQFVNAQITSENRSILLSKASLKNGRGMSFLLGHEFTHQLSTDSNESVIAFIDEVRDAMGADFGKQLEFKGKFYRRMNLEARLSTLLTKKGRKDNKEVLKKVAEFQDKKGTDLSNIDTAASLAEAINEGVSDKEQIISAKELQDIDASTTKLIEEEIAADFAGNLLSNASFRAKVSGMSMTLRQRLAAFAENIRQRFSSDLTPVQIANLDRCKDLWAQTEEESWENAKDKWTKTIKEPTINDAVIEDNEAIDLSRQFNIYTEEGLTGAIMEFADSKDAESLNWTRDQLEDIVKETTDLIQTIHGFIVGDANYDEFAKKDPTMRVDWRDGVEKPIVTWVRNNIEYKYDMSADTFCINNEGLENVLASPVMADLMLHEAAYTYNPKGEKEGERSGYKEDSYTRLYATLRDLGFVVPCKGCFDAAARLKMLPSVSQNFVDAVNKVIDERNRDPKKFDLKLKMFAQKGNKDNIDINGLPTKASTQDMAIRIGVAGDNLTDHIDWTQLMHAKGQTKMLTDWGGIFRAWQRTGAGRPKDKLNPEPYTGQIMTSTSTIIAPYGETTPSFRDLDVNVGTGLRRNSHSEFRPVLAVDEIQFMRDAWLKKLCVFKYMKELDDVRLFGKTGVKFNMSAFAAWDENGVAAGLDKDGNYIFAEESVGGREFPYIGEDGMTHYDGMRGLQEAMKFVNKDCSLSSVIFSVPHLIKALTDVPTPTDKRGLFGSLIPFHSSGATSHSLAVQGLGHARANGVGHAFADEAFTDYNKGVTNFEDVQNDRYGYDYKVVLGKDEGKMAGGHKMEYPDAKVFRNDKLGVTLYKSVKAYREYGADEDVISSIEYKKNGQPKTDKKGNVKRKTNVQGMFYTLDSEDNKIVHELKIDYNDKVRELGGDYAYKEAADYYIQELRKIGLLPRFDFEVPEDVFLKMCQEANIDPNHPKLGWKGAGNGWSPCDAESYYSVFCDYGMTDPETGKLAPHLPVLNGQTAPDALEKAMPENYKEVIKDGIKRYSDRRAGEDARLNEAVAEYCKRSISEGRMSADDVRRILENNGFDDEDIQRAVSYSVDETQIESADYMDGNFGRENGDIKYSITEQKNWDETINEAIREKGLVSPNLEEKHVIVTDVPYHGFTGTLKEVIQKAKEWAINNIRINTPIVINKGTEDEFEYIVSKSSIYEFLNGTAFKNSPARHKAAYISVIKDLQNIASNCIETEIRANYNKKNTYGERELGVDIDRNVIMHEYWGAVNVEGQPFRINIKFKETRNKEEGNPIYAYNLDEIKLYDDTSGETNNVPILHVYRPNSLISATKLLEGIEKSKDKGKFLLEESRKRNVQLSKSHINYDDGTKNNSNGYSVYEYSRQPGESVFEYGMRIAKGRAEEEGRRRLEEQKVFGVPYPGSKNRVVRDIMNILPSGKRFVDLFSGGGAMTHGAMLSGKYDSYRMNDINPTGQQLFLDGIDGKYNDYNREVSREEFDNGLVDTPEGHIWGYMSGNKRYQGDRAKTRAERVAGLSRLADMRGQIEDSASDYRDVELKEGDVVYCDIPYKNTDSHLYGEAGKFDWDAFSEWALQQDVPVYVSSQEAPDGFTEIWGTDVRTNGKLRHEGLYVQDRFATEGDDADESSITEIGGDAPVQYSVVEDPEVLDNLNNDPEGYVEMYCSMAKIDGKYYSPMATMTIDENGKKVINGKGMEKGDWDEAAVPDIYDENGKIDEAKVAANPHLRWKTKKNGERVLEFQLLKPNGKPCWAAFNPYEHSTTSPLNDQFAEAYQRPELVLVRVRIPKSDFLPDENGNVYHVEGAKDGVGEIKWKSGKLSNYLKKHGKERKVTLSKHRQIIGELSAAEEAKAIADFIKGTGAKIPINVVRPQLREELMKLGVPFGGTYGTVANKNKPMLERMLKEYNQARKTAGNTAGTDAEVKYSIYGEDGITMLEENYEYTGRLEKLDIAREMEDAKKSALAIKKATGWERGADGKWRYEMKDGQFKDYASILSDVKAKRGVFKLGEIWDDPELFAAYPELKDKSVWVLGNSSSSTGSYNGAYFEVKFRKDMDDTRSTMVHEIQHAIQRKEGFARGGNKEMSFDNLKELAAEQNAEAKNLSTKIGKKYPMASAFGEYGGAISLKHDMEGIVNTIECLDKFKQVLTDYPELFEGMRGVETKNMLNSYEDTLRKRIQDVYGVSSFDAYNHPAYNAVREIPYNDWHLNAAPTNLEECKEMRDVCMSIAEEGAKYGAKWQKKWAAEGFNIDEIGESGTIGFEGYKRLAGEVESRNASNRLGMTDAERRKTLLSKTEDVDRKDQLILMEGLLRSKKGYDKAMSESGVKYSVEELASESTDELNARAKDVFGTTSNWKETGWLLTDGTQLDFSEKRNGGEPGIRDKDHREIGGAYQGKTDERWQYLMDFGGRGNIRLDAGSGYGTMELMQKPTKEQRSKLNFFIRKCDGTIDIDFMGKNYDVDHSVSYDEATSARILADIDKYYDEGLKPEGNVSYSVDETFYSNAWKGVESIQQKKATGEQWLAMLKNKGFLKEEEDKWMGLSSWLKSQKGSVSKEDVQEYIQSHMIKLEEVEYDNSFETDRSWYGGFDISWTDDYTRVLTPNNGSKYKMISDDDNNEYMIVDENDNIVESGDNYESIFNKFKKLTGTNAGKRPIQEIRLNYTTEGLKNKREIAIVAPGIDPYNADDNVHFGDAGEGRAIGWMRFGDANVPNTDGKKAAEKRLSDAQDKLSKIEDEMQAKYGSNSYYDIESEMTQGERKAFRDALDEYHDAERAKENVNDMAKVLVIDEVQSKRHQDARDNGYRRDILGEVGLKKVSLPDGRYRFADHDGNIMSRNANEVGTYDKDWKAIYVKPTEEQSNVISEYNRITHTLDGLSMTESSVPDAPFRKNWMELIMKRALRYAAENGYDKVAWTTGTQQAERYNLGDQVSTIKVRKIEDGRYHVTPNDKYGNAIEEFDKDYNEAELVSTFGKSLAQTIMTANEARMTKDEALSKIKNLMARQESATPSELELINTEMADARNELQKYVRGVAIIDAKDITIGGEGMKAFYDKMIPSFMNKYTKKWGGKVGSVMLDLPEGETEMWSVDLTPEMSESVMQGQPMYSVDESQVYSENFKNWFGDWENDPENASKVVDEDGKPMVVRHATDDDFFVFDRSKLGKYTDGNASSRELAMSSHIGFWFNDRHPNETGLQRKEMECYLMIKKPLELASLKDIEVVLSNYDNADDFVNDLKKEGFDGIIIDKDEEYGGKSYVVLEPTQIKSATDNNGNFSRYNADIRYSVDEDIYDSEARPELPKKMDGESAIAYQLRIDDALKAQREWDRTHAQAGLTAADAREMVINHIKENLESEHVKEMDKRTLTNIMRTLHAANPRNLQEMVDEAQRLVNHISMKAIRKKVEALINLKVQGRDQKNRSVAKNVDDLTRKIFQGIGETLKGVRTTGLEDDMHKLRSEMWNIRANAVEEGRELTADEQQTIDDKRNELRALEQKQAEIWDKLSAQGVMSVDQQLQEMAERAGDSTEKMSDDDIARWTQLEVTKKIIEAETALSSGNGMQKELASLRRQYEGVLQEERENLNPTEQEHEMYEGMKKYLRSRIRGLQALVGQAQQQYIDSMQGVEEMLADIIKGGKESLLNEKMEERERRSEILRGAIDDVTGSGKGIVEYDDKEWKERGKNPWWKTPFTSALSSFEYMAQRIATRTMGKDSFFYRHFMSDPNTSAMAANAKYVTNLRRWSGMLDEKCQEIFGKTFAQQWEENKNVEEHTGIYRNIKDSEGNYIGSEEKGMSKDTAMYMYMLWQMPDGQAKLLTMGYDDESIAQCKEFAGEKNIRFCNWLQKTFLKDFREPVNEVYKQIYHTSMANIENYVPIKIASQARHQDIDLTGDTNHNAGGVNVKTGSLVNRTVNTLAIDMSRGAMDVIADHVNENIEFMAYAKLRQELAWVLGCKPFRDQLMANGKGLYKRLLKASEIVCHAYHPEEQEMDKLWGKMQKGLVGGNIAFRSTTALKQMLSVPAFYGYSQDPRYLAALTYNIGSEYADNLPAVMASIASFGVAGKQIVKSAGDGGKLGKLLSDNMRWCLENVPNFRQRVLRGDAGEIHLNDEDGFSATLDKLMQVGMTTNQLVDAITVSIGIKSIYDYREARAKDSVKKEAGLAGFTGKEDKQRYIEERMEEERRRAIMDATIYYNSTQQSNDPAFLSPLQVDRTLLARMLTLYKNSPTGYARKMNEGIHDLKRYGSMRNRIIITEQYAKQYEEQGMDEYDARKKAQREIAKKARKGAFDVVLYGLIMNGLWNIGGKGFLGMMTGKKLWELMLGDFDDDDEEQTTAERIAYLSSLPMNGVPGADMTSYIINGLVAAKDDKLQEFGTSILGQETAQSLKEVKRLNDDYGLISTEMLMYLAGRVGRYAGTNPEVLYNCYNAMEDLIYEEGYKDGDDVIIDLMLWLQSPNSNRGDIAKRLYLDEGVSVDEYFKKVAKAMKYSDKDVEGYPISKELKEGRKKQLIQELAKRYGKKFNLDEIETYNKFSGELKNCGTTEQAWALLEKYNYQDNASMVDDVEKRVKQISTPKKDKTLLESLESVIDKAKGTKDVDENEAWFRYNATPEEIRYEHDLEERIKELEKVDDELNKLAKTSEREASNYRRRHEKELGELNVLKRERTERGKIKKLMFSTREQRNPVTMDGNYRKIKKNLKRN